MNENKEILEYIYQTSNMGMESTKDLINSLKGKDNKIKRTDHKIEITRIRKESKPCTLTSTHEK